jgi:EAL domain-containing protein (putative c-di-GMP-specific phosphodiesterase class I)
MLLSGLFKHFIYWSLMSSPALEQYLQRLRSDSANFNSNFSPSLRVDDEGRAVGRYINATLTSVFHPIRSGNDQRIVAYEAHARSYSPNDTGLNIWRLLESAANDSESVELDRLCRLLHAINFFRQAPPESFDLLVSVHSRLLTAIEDNHGKAFRHVLDLLELPHERVILQLPQTSPTQRWVLQHVADNYRRNGFRFGVNAPTVQQAIALIEKTQPHTVKIDLHQVLSSELQEQHIDSLLAKAKHTNTRVIFKRIESASKLDALRTQIGVDQPFYVKGFLFDTPKANLYAADSIVPREIASAC